MKETQARIHSLVQRSTVMHAMPASPSDLDFDSPEGSLAHGTAGAADTPEMAPGAEHTGGSLQVPDQVGGPMGEFLVGDVASAPGHQFGAGHAGPSASASAAGSLMEPYVGCDDAEYQPFSSQLEAWGVWDPRLTLGLSLIHI